MYQRLKIVSLGKRHTMLLEPRLKIFFSTLLSMETGGVIIWRRARSHLAQQRGKIPFGLGNPLMRQWLHIIRIRG